MHDVQRAEYVVYVKIFSTMCDLGTNRFLHRVPPFDLAYRFLLSCEASESQCIRIGGKILF